MTSPRQTKVPKKGKRKNKANRSRTASPSGEHSALTHNSLAAVTSEATKPPDTLQETKTTCGPVKSAVPEREQGVSLLDQTTERYIQKSPQPPALQGEHYLPFQSIHEPAGQENFSTPYRLSQPPGFQERNWTLTKVPQLPVLHEDTFSVFSSVPREPPSPKTPDSPTHRRARSSSSAHSGESEDTSFSTPSTRVGSPAPSSFLKSPIHLGVSRHPTDLFEEMAKADVETLYPREDSFIHAGNGPVRDLRDLPSNGTSDNGKSLNGRKSSPRRPLAEKSLADASALVDDNVSFAEALKEQPNLDDTTRSEWSDGLDRNGAEAEVKCYASHAQAENEARSEDSYPELDEMTAEDMHMHESLPRYVPYGRVRWAPWNVPAKRRLQTLIVLIHCLCITITVSAFFALCAIPLVWPLLLVYLMHVLNTKAVTDGSLRYRSEWFRSSYIWDLFAGYFPAKLHKTHDLPPTRKYIFGYHPHGIISHGAWAAFATEALGFGEKFPGITNSLLTLETNFRIPIYRDYMLAMGVRSVSKESIVNILSRGGANNEGMGRAVTIVVGGARESLAAQPGQLRLVLKERKGFIKLAVRTGADLVPVLAFGENELYDQLQPEQHPLVHRIQMFILKVWKFTLPFLHGRGIFNYDVGMMPYRHPLNVVVGAPIKVTQSNAPDNDEIDRLHGLYIDELDKIWNSYKDEFAENRKEEMQILS